MTIVNKANYQTLACSADQHIATAWTYKDDNGDEVAINENQELLNDWKDQKRAAFHFHQTKFNIVLRDDDEGNYLVCSKGNQVCIAREFSSIWFIVGGETSKDKKAIKEKKAFSAARSAFANVCQSIFDSLEEAGV